MTETSRIEYKRELNDRVVAYLNAREGCVIWIGVDNSGEVASLADCDRSVFEIFPNLLRVIFHYAKPFGAEAQNELDPWQVDILKACAIKRKTAGIFLQPWDTPVGQAISKKDSNICLNKGFLKCPPP